MIVSLPELPYPHLWTRGGIPFDQTNGNIWKIERHLVVVVAIEADRSSSRSTQLKYSIIVRCEQVGLSLEVHNAFSMVSELYKTPSVHYI
jgi:hypothetical protein